MTFYRAKPGGWTDGDAVTARELTILDAQASLMMNTNATGSYPGALTFTADQTINGNIIYTPDGHNGYIYKQVLLVNPTQRTGTWTEVGDGSWLDASATNPTALTFIFRLPVGAILKTVTAYIDPTDGHAGTNLFTRPVLSVDVLDVELDAQVSGMAVSQADTTAYGAAYEALHAITATTNASAVAWQNDWVGAVSLASEYGTDALTGLQIAGIKVKFIPRNLDPRRSA